MIKYSGIYESSTPPPSTKALWVDGGVLKIYKNGSWRPVDDPKSKLNIDSILKAGSTNPVENKAIYNRFIGVDKDIEVNKNNIGVLTGRVNEVDGIAKGAEALAKVNEKRINSVEALANANEAKSQDNASKIYTLSYNLADVKNTADGNKHDIESLTNRTIKPIESKVLQLQELNVVYPNNIRNLTTESTVAEVKEAFIPAIGGTADRVNTPHVGYLIKGAAYEDSSEDNPEYGPDSTIISVDIIKTDNKDYHKFIYVDNNTAIISVTVDLVNYRLIDKSTLANIEATSKVGTLRDLYVSAGARYNEATGYYELNGLTDITEEEMRKIYLLYITNSPKAEHIVSWLSYPNDFRTNIAPRVYYVSNIQNSIGGNDVLEVLVLSVSALYIQNLVATAHGSFPKLRRVIGYWVYANNNPSKYDFSYGQPFSNCPLLEEIRMKSINKSHTFAVSPNLSKESVLYMITNANPPSGAAAGSIAITLHPTAYARLKDDADIVAALEAKEGIVTLVSA